MVITYLFALKLLWVGLLEFLVSRVGFEGVRIVGNKLEKKDAGNKDEAGVCQTKIKRKWSGGHKMTMM